MEKKYVFLLDNCLILSNDKNMVDITKILSLEAGISIVKINNNTDDHHYLFRFETVLWQTKNKVIKWDKHSVLFSLSLENQYISWLNNIKDLMYNFIKMRLRNRHGANILQLLKDNRRKISSLKSNGKHRKTIISNHLNKPIIYSRSNSASLNSPSNMDHHKYTSFQRINSATTGLIPLNSPKRRKNDHKKKKKKNI